MRGGVRHLTGLGVILTTVGHCHSESELLEYYSFKTSTLPIHRTIIGFEIGKVFVPI